LTLVLLHIYLIPQNDKGEVLWVMRASLDEKFISPTVKGLKRLCTVDVVHEHTAIRPPIECDTQRLEAFLACCIPKLQRSYDMSHTNSAMCVVRKGRYLHSD
jgi:hypothetical protein